MRRVLERSLRLFRKIIGTRGAVQFSYFNSYTDADSNALDVFDLAMKPTD